MLLVWHGTNVEDISTFYNLSHFGTKKSAQSRLGCWQPYNTFLYKCYINSRGFVEIQDYGNEMDMFAKDLLDQKILNSEEYSKVSIRLYQRDIETWRKNISKILINKGIFGFKYVNVAEGIGDTSYIVVDGAEVDILNVYEYDYKNKSYNTGDEICI